MENGRKWPKNQGFCGEFYTDRAVFTLKNFE
jgi:hypothetical protein